MENIKKNAISNLITFHVISIMVCYVLYVIHVRVHASKGAKGILDSYDCYIQLWSNHVHVHTFFVIFYVIAEKILYLTNPTNLLHTHFHLFKIIHLLFNGFNYSFAIKSNLFLLLTNLSYFEFRRMNGWLKLNGKLISSLLF